MITSIDIRKTVGLLWEKHTFLCEMMNLTGITNNWKEISEKPSQVISIDQPKNLLQLGKQGVIVALIAKQESSLCKEFQVALKSNNAFLMKEIFVKLSDRIADIDNNADTDVNHLVDITYQGKSVMSNIVIDEALGFHFVTIDFYGTDIANSDFEVTYKSRPEVREKFETVLCVSPPEYTELEKIALEYAPLSEIGVKVSFTPRADLIGDVVHHVKHAAEDVAHKGVDAAKDVGHAADKGAHKAAHAAKDVGHAVDKGAHAVDKAKNAVEGKGVKAANKAVKAVKNVANAATQEVEAKTAQVGDETANVGKKVVDHVKKAAQDAEATEIDDAATEITVGEIADADDVAATIAEALGGGRLLSTHFKHMDLSRYYSMDSEASVDALIAYRNSVLRKQAKR